MDATKTLFRNEQEYHYTETITENDYAYEIDTTLDDAQVEIFISSGGVSICYQDGANHTNITPNSLFPHAKKLSNTQLIYLLDLLHNINYEGRFLYADEINEIIEEQEEL